MTKTISRATLRRKLKDAGLPSASGKYDASGFTITEFANFWGVLPGWQGGMTGDIQRALDNADIRWEMGNMVMVPKIQTA